MGLVGEALAQRSGPAATCRSPARPTAGPPGRRRPWPRPSARAGCPARAPARPAGSAVRRAAPRSGLRRDPRPSTCQAASGSAKPLRRCGPRSASSNRPPTRRRVAWLITTLPGAASAWRRAARFGVSPTTACSCAAPRRSARRPPPCRWRCRPALPVVRLPASPVCQPPRSAPARRARPAPPRPRAPVASRSRRARRRPGTWRRDHPSVDHLGAAFLIGARSPGPCPRDRAAPPAPSSPTRSTNITVSCRRSAAGARGVGGVGRSAAGAASGPLSSRIALSSLTRWPSGRPSSLRCSSVSSTSASAIDRVVGEQLGILAEALRLQPLSQIGHDRPPRAPPANLQPKYGLRSVDCRRRSVLQIWARPACLCRAAARGGLSPAGAVARVRCSAVRSCSLCREMQRCPVPAGAVAQARCSAVPFLLALWLGRDAVLSR